MIRSISTVKFWSPEKSKFAFWLHSIGITEVIANKVKRGSMLFYKETRLGRDAELRGHYIVKGKNSGYVSLSNANDASKAFIKEILDSERSKACSEDKR